MTTTKRNLIALLVIAVFALAGCSEIRTTNASKAYSYWAGSAPPKIIEVLNGQYWQSGHWTKIIYSAFKTKNSKRLVE